MKPVAEPTAAMLAALAAAEALEAEGLPPYQWRMAERLGIIQQSAGKRIRGLRRFGLWRWDGLKREPSQKKEREPGQSRSVVRPRRKYPVDFLVETEVKKRRKAGGSYGRSTVESLEEWRRIAAPWIHGIR